MWTLAALHVMNEGSGRREQAWSAVRLKRAGAVRGWQADPFLGACIDPATPKMAAVGGWRWGWGLDRADQARPCHVMSCHVLPSGFFSLAVLGPALDDDQGRKRGDEDVMTMAFGTSSGSHYASRPIPSGKC